MTRKKLWIATNNQHKVKEFQELLPNYEIKSLLDLDEDLIIEENGKTFAENAMIKAKALAVLINEPSIGDDSGLMVKALNGFPGVYSKRWAYPIVDEQEINAKLLEKMQGLKNRQATFETVIAYYNPQANIEKVFSGSIEGTITLAPRGEKVFGYDQIFQPIHSQKTFSELESAKNEFSHRQMAIQKFINYEQGSENNDSEN